jgi:hypothetical protein
MMLTAARQTSSATNWKIFLYSDPRHGPAPIGALGSQARKTRSLWPATHASTRSPATFRENMSCIRSRLPGAISKPGFGPWSMITQRSKRGSHVPAAPTTSPRSRNCKVSRIGQWNGILTISRPKLPSTGSSGAFKRKLSWNRRSTATGRFARRRSGGGGHLTQRVAAIGFGAVLLVRVQFREVQRDLRLPRRGCRLRDLAVDFRDRAAAGRSQSA